MTSFMAGCPGGDLVKRPFPEYVMCPTCGAEVELWSDESETTCPQCKTEVNRGRLPLCIDWCEYACECFGAETYRRVKGLTGEQKTN